MDSFIRSFQASNGKNSKFHICFVGVSPESPSPHTKPGGPKGRHGPGLIMEDQKVNMLLFGPEKGVEMSINGG